MMPSENSNVYTKERNYCYSSYYHKKIAKITSEYHQFMTIRGENGEVIPIEKGRLKKANYAKG